MRTTSATKRKLYPWRTWFDGQQHVAESGLDFDIDVDWFKQGVLRAARRLGVKVEVRIVGSGEDLGVWMQAQRKDAE